MVTAMTITVTAMVVAAEEVTTAPTAMVTDGPPHL